MKYQDNRHFSHEHFLLSLNITNNNEEDEQQQKIHCDACKEKITEKKPFFHGCLKCNYHLHDHCFQAPRSIQHESHPLHPLSLLSIPTYSSRFYLCDACGGEGGVGAFSYICAHCGFDIHLKCALLPHSAVFNEIHPHEVTLKFDKNDCEGSKDGEIKSSCGVCDGDLKENLWLYYCGECDFAVHLDCVNGHNKTVSPQNSKKSYGDDDGADDNDKVVEAKEDADDDDEEEEVKYDQEDDGDNEDDDSDVIQGRNHDEEDEEEEEEEEALMQEKTRSRRQRIRILIRLHRK